MLVESRENGYLQGRAAKTEIEKSIQKSTRWNLSLEGPHSRWGDLFLLKIFRKPIV